MLRLWYECTLVRVESYVTHITECIVWVRLPLPAGRARVQHITISTTAVTPAQHSSYQLGDSTWCSYTTYTFWSEFIATVTVARRQGLRTSRPQCTRLQLQLVNHVVSLICCVDAGGDWSRSRDDHGQVCFVLARSISSPFVRRPAVRVACALLFVTPLLLPRSLFFVHSTLAEPRWPLPRHFTRSVLFCRQQRLIYFSIARNELLISLIWVIVFCIMYVIPIAPLLYCTCLLRLPLLLMDNAGCRSYDYNSNLLSCRIYIWIGPSSVHGTATLH